MVKEGRCGLLDRRMAADGAERVDAGYRRSSMAYERASEGMESIISLKER